MEFQYRKLILSLSILSLSTLSALSHSSFYPLDNFLIDCGSTVGSTVDNRLFVPDSAKRDSSLSSSTRSITLRNENPPPNSPQIYSTARAFRRPSKYKFQIRDEGTHMVRLHFQTFNSLKFDWNNTQFHVLVNGFVALADFRAGGVESPMVMEFLIWVSTGKLVIEFVPAKKSNFAFVNAIEVISAPKDLVADTAKFVSSDKVEDFNGLAKQALQVVHRVNVGGSKVTPFNDSIWRTWVTDDEYLEPNSGSKRVYFGGRIKYQDGGASREVGPDNVYNSARVIHSTNASIPKVNMTWVFPAVAGYKYLVRMHFCDIASISIGLLYFNVYVNGNLAYENLDLSMASNYILASPFYADFVVDGDDSGVLRVSVGPSNMSVPYAIDGVLNGIEIMKLNNSMGSLDGDYCAGWVLRNWPSGHVGFVVPLVAAACLLLSISLVMRRKMNAEGFVAWSRLPMDVSEANAKHGNAHPSS
ncbi:unnamed protein product [Prunus brigantina]